MSATPSVKTDSTPKGYLCTLSLRIMEEPRISVRCGHLFDASVIGLNRLCPIDQKALDDTVPCAELKDRISAYTKSIKINVVAATSSLASGSSSRPRNAAVENIRRIENAHQDDIHGFLALSPECFVSGSKDTSIKMWDHQGSQKNDLRPKSLSGFSYKYWVTALGTLESGNWASGSRDGYINLWDAQGKELTEFQYVAKDPSIAKQRNLSRINCIAAKAHGGFYVGTPKYVHVYDEQTGLVKSYQAHANDWVYCIEELTPEQLIVVIGSSLQHWQMDWEPKPQKTDLIQETKNNWLGNQRPHISCITRLDHRPNYLLAALFNATVLCIDISREGKLLNEFCEHKPIKDHSRVWSVIQLKGDLFASSADDGMIKIWDVHQKKSVATLGNNPGRVSSLLKLSDNVFISGSCPDNFSSGQTRASITFWDIRNLKSDILFNGLLLI